MAGVEQASRRGGCSPWPRASLKHIGSWGCCGPRTCGCWTCGRLVQGAARRQLRGSLPCLVAPLRSPFSTSACPHPCTDPAFPPQGQIRAPRVVLVWAGVQPAVPESQVGLEARRAVTIPQPQELSAFWFLSLRFFCSISRKTTGSLQQGQGTALPGEGAPAGTDICSQVWGPRQTSALGSACTELTTQQPRTNAEKDGTLCREITLLASRAPNSWRPPSWPAQHHEAQIGWGCPGRQFWGCKHSPSRAAQPWWDGFLSPRSEGPGSHRSLQEARAVQRSV